MNKKILIIEDDRDIRNAFKKQLDLLGGYDTDLAEGGEEGLEKMAETQYDLVLLDLVMPGFDGIELLQALKDNQDKYKKAPVIAVTNVTAVDTKQEAEKLGIVKYVVKTDTDIDVVIDEFFNS